LETKAQLAKIELKKQKFKAEAHNLEPNDKQKQLEKIIEDNARIAKEMKPLL
jgi:beta-lactam-binding protein with PASTA domain